MRVGQAFALIIFALTVVLLVSLAVAALVAGVATWSRAALVASTFAAALACLAMLVDAFDRWVMGRRMSVTRLRLVRSSVLASVAVAFVLSIFGRNTLIFLLMAPALIAYLFVVRAAPTMRSSRGTRPAGGPSRGGGGRQRRGGRKRRS
jgi:hypothetical protein